MSETFLNVLGNNPQTRLLEFLIIERNFDYSLTELSEKAGIGWATLHRLFPNLKKQKMIIQTREIGRAKLFKLNLENENVKQLVKLFDTIMSRELDEIAEKHSQTVRVKAK